MYLNKVKKQNTKIMQLAVGIYPMFIGSGLYLIGMCGTQLLGKD